MKNFNFLKRVLWLLIPLLTLFNIVTWGSPAPANTTLWAETWTDATCSNGSSGQSSANPDDNCSTSKGTTIYGGASISYTQSNNTNVYCRNENTGGGTAPELFIKASNTWTITGISTGEAEDLTLTYKSNKSPTVAVSTTEKGKSPSITGSAKNYTITTDGASTITLVFSASENSRVDDVSLKVKTAGGGGSTPTISTSSTMTTFGCNMTTGVPTVQNFSVSGSNLSANLTVTPPSGYEICLTSGGTYQTSAISLTPSTGTVSSTTIYVRLKDTNAAGSYSGNIACASTGATTQNVAISGSTPFTVTWKANSTTVATTYVTYASGEGTAIGTLPTDPDPDDYSCTGKAFYGWYDGASYSHASTAPSVISTSTKITTDKTFNAVFADASAGAGGYEYIGDDEVLEEDETYIFVSSKSAGTAYAIKASDLPSTNGTAAGVSVTVTSAGGKIKVATVNTNLEFLCTSHTSDWDDLEEVAHSGRLLVINGNGLGYAETGKSWYDAEGLQGCNSKCNKYYDVYHNGSAFTHAEGAASRVYAFKKSSITYTNFATTCCTKLGSINGSVNLTQGGNSVTISGWSDVANVGTYTVRMYKKNGASWDLVSGSTSGGSAGTQGTRTGITSGSKSVTYTGLVVESEYKFTVQAIAGSASYCDGDETAVTDINSTDVSSTPFKFRYSICIDNGSGSDWTHHYIEPTGNANEGTVTINLPAHVDSYQFKIYGGFSGNWGQTGTGKIPAATKWTLNGSNQVKLNTGAGGDYVFTVDYSGTTNPGVTVTFPSANQASGYKIYFDKSIIDGWGSTLKYRIGNNTDNQNQNFTLVTGTDNFYVTTTPSYNSMDAWQIANNTAWTPGDHDAAHGIYNYHHGDAYDITKATVYFDYVVEGDITMVPSSKKNTENSCDFWYVTKTDGMLTHTATITPPSNGTINLAYTNTSGTSCPTNTSTVSNLAHRTILTATANPSTGYQLSTFTVTPSGESAQNLSSGDNHILAKDATFAATFAAKTYAISLDRNGGTTGATEVTMTYNSSSFTGWSAPSRTGYTFDGYYTSETDDNGSGTLVINSSGVLQANVDGYTGANGIWTKDATCTLYAKWTANTTTVTLTAGTGTNGSASINYDATSYTSFSAAVRVGYTCTGYWTNTGGTGTKILNANGSFAASTISGYVTSDKWSYTTASTLTLYAGWTNTYAGYAFDLLEDVRDISAGSKIILIGTNAAGDTYKAMTTAQGDNNRGSVAAGSGEFVMSNSNKTATLGASTSVQVITLEDLATPADNTYQFNVENGYLYAAGTSNARLKTQTPNSAYGHWLVAVDANTKKATMTGQGGNSYNKIYYNNSSSIFAGYSNAQQPTYIYFNETRTKYTITWDKNGHGTAPTYPTNAARVTMPDISVTGYTNTGWKADKAVTNVSSGATISAGTLISNDTRVQLSANTTFTAQWSTDEYSISTTLTNISVNSAFPSSFTYTGATTTDLDRTLSVTSAYALPTNLTVTMGGNACTNGTEYTYDSSSGEFTFNVVITGNIVITGTALNKYTLTLNPGNGSLTEGGGWSADGDNLVQVVVEGNTVTMPSATPGCAGWVFKGWNEDTSVDNVSSNPVDKAGGATFTPAATKTYYAVYRASTSTGTTYTKITDEAELTTGEYAIVAGNSYYYAMGNEISTSHMTESTSFSAASSWTNSNADYIWTVIKAGNKVGFYNADAGKFLTIVEGAWVLDATDGQKFSYSFNSSTKAWTFTSPSGKQMRYASYYYVGDEQSAPIYLFKRGNTESGNYYTSPSCASLTVTGISDPVGAATVHLSSTTAKNGDVIWATYTLNRGYTFNSWDKSGTGASLSSTSAEFTKLTVGSADPTITVNCDALTSYTLNYHDGEGNHTMTAYEGERILEILPEASESCDGESTTYTGWSTSEIRTKTDDEPTYVSSSAVINSTTAASTYYAVYANVVTPDGTLSILGSLGSSFWGGSYNSSDKEIKDSNGNTITLNTDNVIFQNPSSVNCVQIKNASGAGFWNDTEIPGNITQIKIKCETSGAKIYVGTTKKPTSSNEKTVSSTSEQTYDFDASDGLTYFSVFSNSATPQIKSMIITYVGEYGDYITTCCDAPTITISGTGKTVTDGKISFPVLREDLGGASSTTWAELPITISSNSSGEITIITGTGGDTDKTAWKLSSWESRAETGGTIAATDHATFTSPSAGNYLFKVKTTTGYTGQGTYRIGIHQEANGTYCEATVYLWVDVTLRDKFVDKVNANTTINVDGLGSTVTTPTESSLDADKNDDCHETTRRLVGWVKETDMDTWYGSSSDRTRDLDDKKDDAKLVAPGATITTSGATWYAVWGIEE